MNVGIFLAVAIFAGLAYGAMAVVIGRSIAVGRLGVRAFVLTVAGTMAFIPLLFIITGAIRISWADAALASAVMGVIGLIGSRRRATSVIRKLQDSERRGQRP